MFNGLTTLGWGLVLFAIVLGVGSVVLAHIQGSVAECNGITSGAWNYATSNCTNGTGLVAGTSNLSWSYVPGNAAYSNTNYLLGQLGQSGLAGWAPAVIAVSVGMFIIGALAINTGGQQGRQY